MAVKITQKSTGRVGTSGGAAVPPSAKKTVEEEEKLQNNTGASSSGRVKIAQRNSQNITSTSAQTPAPADYQKRLSQLQEQRRQAQVDLDTETVSRLDNEMKALRASAGKQTVRDRWNDILSGASNTGWGQTTNAVGTLMTGADYNERQIASLQKVLDTGYTSDGKPITDAQRKGIEDSIARMQRENAQVQNDPNHAGNKLQQTADTMTATGEKQIEDAKAGLGATGQFLVDTGVAGVQLAGDIAASALLPGAGTALMGARAFGGSAQEARQAGATRDQQLLYGAGSAATSMLTEKLGNVGGAFKTAFGAGILDKALAKVTAKPAGKLIAAALSEGGEEFIEALAQPLLQKLTYNPDAAYDEEWLSEALYSAAIGAVLGGAGTAISPSTYITEPVGTNPATETGAGAKEQTFEGKFTPKEENATESLKTPIAEGQVNPEQKAVQAAYEAGKANLPRERTDIASEAQEEAYLDGQRERIANASDADLAIENQQPSEYTGINKTEVMNDEEIRLRDGSQRIGSENPGGEVSAVESGAGRNQNWKAQSRSADREAVKLTYDEKAVSTSSLGITGGSTAENIRIVTGGDTAFTEVARNVAKKRGLRLVLFAGNNLEIRQADGSVASVRAYISGDRVFIRVDHPLFTSDQLMRHEAGHDMIAKGEVNLDDVRNRIETKHGKEKVGQLAQMYVDAYEGTGMTSEEIWEEVVCDSLGDMNIFAETASEQAAHELLTETKKATADTEATQTRGPPVDGKASRELDVKEGEGNDRAREVYGGLDGNRQDVFAGGPGRGNAHARGGGGREALRFAELEAYEQDRLTRLLTNAVDKSETWRSVLSELSMQDAAALVYDKIVQNDPVIERMKQQIPGFTLAVQQAREFVSNDVTNANVAADHNKAAVEHFGKTYKWSETGYLLLDGSKLDFSGKHEGAPGGYRTVDHRDIGDAIGGEYGGDSYSGAMVQFMSEGNIRISPESNGINLSVRPTKAQERALDDYISRARGEVILDIDDTNGNTLFSVEYPRGTRATKVLNDIRQYFTDGTEPQVSQLSQFHFSRELDSVNALREQNEALQEKVEYWKNQTKRTVKPTLRQDDVDKLAKKIVKNYDGGIDATEISGELKELGEYIVRAGEEFSWTEVKDRAMNIARKVVNSASVLVNGEAMEDYNGIKAYLKKQKLAFDDKGDIADYNDFRKRNFGRFTISKDGLPIDVAWSELRDTFGESYFPSNIKNPADQLQHIADLFNSMEAIFENPFSYHMAEATEYVANDIVDRLFSDDLRLAPPTFADKQAAKLDKQKAKDKAKLDKLRQQKNERIAEIRKQGAERTKAALEKVRADRDAKIKDLKGHYKAVADARRARAEDSKARTRLLRIAKRLQNKKLPAANRALVDQYIGDLDTVAKSLTDGKAQDLQQLRDWYEDQRDNNPDFIADPHIEKALSRLSKKHISDLTAQEVEDLTNVLLNIENEIRTQKKLIDSEERRDVYNMGVQVISDIQNTKGSKEGDFLDKYIVTETLSPVRQVRRMTGYVDSDPLYVLTNELADGQRKMFDYQRKAGDLFLKWTKDSKFVDCIAGKAAQEIKVSGIGKNGPTTVTITPAMRMSLYLHSMNSQNLKHIAGGGVTVPDVKLYKEGKLAAAYARGTTIKLTPSEVRSITAGMTTQEKAFAMAAHAYFNGMSQDSINEVSEKLKGYSLAKVENYFPINTDTSFTKSDFEALKFDGTIEGMGFLKERVNSSSPIMLRDMDSVLKQSIDNTAKYVGLGIPVRNFNKVWGVTQASFNEDGTRNNYESSVQQAVKQKWGDDGYKYIENMMTDLNSGRPAQDNWAKVLNKIKSNYAGAVLTLNASVAMKQAASYPTAGAVVGFKPLAKAMANVGKVDLDLINKYTPLLWYRTQGFSTQELGDMAKRNKSLPKVLNWVQGVDVLTTRKLWKAAEYYVLDTQKSLERGTDAYYKAVADVYNQIIEETQPNYTTMQRPQLLRSENSLMQNLSMFKTQPFQNFNILYDAVGNLKAKQTAYTNTGTEEAKADLNAAKQRAAWAATSQLAQLAVFAGMTFAWNMFRGKRDKYKDEEEDEMTTLSALKGIGKDMLGGAASVVPFGSDVWELLSSKLFGDTYYGMDAVTVQALTDAVTSVSGLADLITDTAKSMAAGEEVDWNNARLKFDNYFDDISKTFGVPYENVVNLFNAIYLQSATAVQGKYLGTYAAMKLTTSKTTYANDYYDLLYKAYKNDRAAYEAIYADMVSSGFDPEKISNGMENRMKKEQGVTKVSEMEQRYLSPDVQKQYDKTLKTVQQSSVWKRANGIQRDSLEDNLYTLLSGTDASEKMRKKIDEGAPHNIGDADYLLFKLALEMTDKPNENGKLKTYTNDEVEAAIEMLGLSDSESSYLWLAQGKSEKSNPWE